MKDKLNSMRVLVMPFVLILFSFFSNAQINKGSFLYGGSGAFSQIKQIDSAFVFYKETTVTISGDVGYFIYDKLCFGLNTGFEHDKRQFPDFKSNSYFFNVGPFARYYLMPSERKVNIFSQLSDQTMFNWVTETDQNNKATKSTTHDNRLTTSVGFAAFLYPSIALEFSVGYQVAFEGNNTNAAYNRIVAGIWFQIHH